MEVVGDDLLVERDSQQLGEWMKKEDVEKVRRSFGVLRDTIGVAQPAVEGGYKIAQISTSLGFEIGKMAVRAPFQLARLLGAEVGEAPQMAMEAVLDVAHGVTKESINLSNAIVRNSLYLTDSVLEFGGAEKGETVRLLEDYVESQKGLDESYEVKAALLGLAKLLGELSDFLVVDNPIKLIAGAQGYAEIQSHHRETRKREWLERHIETPPLSPMSEELQVWHTFIHYSAASYGFGALQFLGIIPDHVRRMDIVDDHAGIEALTGVPKKDVVRIVQQGEMYRPGYVLAVDHKRSHIVLSIRGTMRLHDVLVDLVCEQTEFVSIFDEGDQVVEGKAHRGFLKSAQRLAGDLHHVVAELFEVHPGYDLVITGHSLGAGVATILALLWARMPPFRERNIRAFTFASPCSVCPAIAKAPFTQRHVTSVVVGDDIVSRLSLSSFKDLQRGMITMTSTNVICPLEKVEIYKALPRQPVESKLFPAGMVWLVDNEEVGHPIIQIDPVEVLHSIEITPTMFNIHLPHQYIDAIKGKL